MGFKKKGRRVSEKQFWNVNNRSCSGKSRYYSEEAAWEHCNRIYDEHGEELRPYKCRCCGLWHLTSNI